MMYRTKISIISVFFALPIVFLPSFAFAQGAGQGQEELELATAGAGEPVTKEDIQEKCLDGSFSNILSDIIQVGLGKLFSGLGFGLGEDVPTQNEQISFQQIGAQVEACTRDLIEKSSKVMLQNLQKKLMDQLVNQTIDWINNEKEPKYVSNFWDFAKDALEEAGGDVIRELDLAKLYPNENFKDYLISAIKERSRNRERRFSENISFNLDKQVDDVEAFQNDFTQGAFPALIVASDFANNPAGQALMVGLYLDAKESQELANAASRVTSDGFTADVVCTTWVLVKKDPNSPNEVGGAYVDPATGKEKIKMFPPEEAPNINNPPAGETMNGQDYIYICPNDYAQNGEVIKTPSGIVQSVAQKGVLQQFDYVLTAKDINGYVSQIAEAAVNKLMRDGIAFFGSTAGKIMDYLPKDILTDVQNYNQNYSGESVRNESKLAVRENLIPRAEKLIADSSALLGNQSAQGSVLWFEARINFLESALLSTKIPRGLIECMAIKPGFLPDNYPKGCSLFPPPGTCSLQFTGKTVNALRTEMRSFVDEKRATNTLRKNEAQDVFDASSDILPIVKNISEATPLSVINELKTGVKNAETKFKKTRDDFESFKQEVNPIINHIDVERKECVGPEIAS